MTADQVTGLGPWRPVHRDAIGDVLVAYGEEGLSYFAAAIDAAVAAGYFQHGGVYGDIDMPDPTDGACCIGCAVKGPQWCTCWTPQYDLDQQDPRPGRSGQRTSPCPDCAYRLGSPERAGDDRYTGSEPGFLDQIVVTSEPFWCHIGMRQPVRLVHPCGAEVDLRAAAPGAYQPPIVGGVPFKADGTPGDLCGGWSARRRKHLLAQAAEIEARLGGRAALLRRVARLARAAGEARTPADHKRLDRQLARLRADAEAFDTAEASTP